MKNLPKLPRYLGGNTKFHDRHKVSKILSGKDIPITLSNYLIYLSTNHGSKIHLAQELSLVDHIINLSSPDDTFPVKSISHV